MITISFQQCLFSHWGPNYPWSHMTYNCHGLFSFFNLEQFLLFWLSFGHWFLKCKGPVVLQKRPQCGFVWRHFFMLWFRFCLLGQGAHRSGVRSPLRTLRTRVPWWRRRLPSFSIVTVPCFFPPLELTSKPKFSRKSPSLGKFILQAHLKELVACTLQLGFGNRSSGFGLCSTEQLSVLPPKDKEFGAWMLAMGWECQSVYQLLNGRVSGIWFPGVTDPSRGAALHGPKHMYGEHSAEHGDFSSLWNPLLFSATNLRPGLHGKICQQWGQGSERVKDEKTLSRDRGPAGPQSTPLLRFHADFSLCLVAPVITLCDRMDCSPPGSSVHVDSSGKNTGVGCRTLFQGIFPTQGSNPGLAHCRQIFYRLSYQGSPLAPQKKATERWGSEKWNNLSHLLQLEKVTLSRSV